MKETLYNLRDIHRGQTNTGNRQENTDHKIN